eukprot:6768153-Prymnesium_polylepis.1
MVFVVRDDLSNLKISAGGRLTGEKRTRDEILTELPDEALNVSDIDDDELAAAVDAVEAKYADLKETSRAEEESEEESEEEEDYAEEEEDYAEAAARVAARSPAARDAAQDLMQLRAWQRALRRLERRGTGSRLRSGTSCRKLPRRGRVKSLSSQGRSTSTRRTGRGG